MPVLWSMELEVKGWGGFIVVRPVGWGNPGSESTDWLARHSVEELSNSNHIPTESGPKDRLFLNREWELTPPVSHSRGPRNLVPLSLAPPSTQHPGWVVKPTYLFHQWDHLPQDQWHHFVVLFRVACVIVSLTLYILRCTMLGYTSAKNFAISVTS